MSETPTDQSEEYSKDHLVITHSDGRSEKFSIPDGDKVLLRIGRELDNDVVLTDPRSSRHHAEIRRSGSIYEIKDLGSANGILIDETKVEPEEWTKILPGQTLQLAETRIVWKQALTNQATVAMKPQARETTVAAAPVPAAAAVAAPAEAAPQQKQAALPEKALPWAVIIGAVVVLLIGLGLAFILIFGGSDDAGDTANQDASPPSATEEPSQLSGRNDENLTLQTPVGGPTPTPTPSGPQLAIPILQIMSTQVSPIIFGASPSTTSAYIFIDVRAQNAGNIPFQFSISNFSLQTRKGEKFTEAGSNTSENYLRQLGAIDRFENLALTPGGSVPGSLVFELEIGTYDFELVFDAPDVSPIVLGLGSIEMQRELSLAAGTPAADLDADTPAAEPTPTLEPTPTPTRPPLIPAPQVVPRSALVGTIAYPAFDGETYNIYFGDVESTESTFFRSQASQPAFSPDGSEIAFHSWDNSSRGIVTMPVSGGNPIKVGTFVEDQLPTWTNDGSEIILLSRRSGDRKSTLIRVGSKQERSDGTVLGEGEYPTVGPDDRLVFKGWGNTAFGLRSSTINMEDIESLTNVEEDTAPMLSPDGERLVFMSRREENWDIYASNADGSDLIRLTTDPAQDGLPTWSPDGNAIAFVSDRGGIWAVWVMTPEGKAQTQRFTMEGSPDGFVGQDTFASRGWAEERISWIR